MVASIAKASQPGAIPGKISEDLSHHSFVFRAHRTFMNTLENLPAMLATFMLAIFVGVEPLFLGIYTLAYVGFRVIHMLLYYLIATEKNPSPRSYFFILGFLSNLSLLVHSIVQIAH
ncbi:MAPEG family protein [Gayadomonas joobiniege]|uniref:MAPEG family protein n=1 Tax=Gayadomonas joobiniege TaxID=1234606 RepID=UPI001ED9B6EF